MHDLTKTIKHFESLQKRYTTEHNGQMCERVADALEALYRAQRDVTWSMDHVDTMDQMIDYVEKLPVEDVELPKVGKWISASTKPGVQIGMKCSECKARITYSEYFNGNHNYCHKCGANMIKE